MMLMAAGAGVGGLFFSEDGSFNIHLVVKHVEVVFLGVTIFWILVRKTLEILLSGSSNPLVKQYRSGKLDICA